MRKREREEWGRGQFLITILPVEASERKKVEGKRDRVKARQVERESGWGGQFLIKILLARGSGMRQLD